MTTGSVNKAPAEPPPHLATGLRFSRNRIIVRLQDGREVSIPIEHYPTLQRATPAQRDGWRLIGPGKAFYWPQLDLDLSVEGLVLGHRERIPRPPSLPWLKPRGPRKRTG